MSTPMKPDGDDNDHSSNAPNEQDRAIVSDNESEREELPSIISASTSSSRNVVQRESSYQSVISGFSSGGGTDSSNQENTQSDRTSSIDTNPQTPRRSSVPTPHSSQDEPKNESTTSSQEENKKLMRSDDPRLLSSGYEQRADSFIAPSKGYDILYPPNREQLPPYDRLPSLSSPSTSLPRENEEQGSDQRDNHPNETGILSGEDEIPQSEWRRDSDINSRQEMVENIMEILQEMNENESEDWIVKLPEMVKQLEETLYRSAPSFAAYADKSTLKGRLQSLALNFAEKEEQEEAQRDEDGSNDQLSSPSNGSISDSDYLYVNDDSPNDTTPLLPPHSTFQEEDILVSSNIQDIWNNWAFTTYLKQATIYFILMSIVILGDWTHDDRLNIARIATMGLGWIYFIHLEGLKIWRSKSIIQYFCNFWNVWQNLTLALILSSVIFDIHDILFWTIMPSEFAGVVQFFVFINFLQFSRGFDNVAWVIFTLKQVGKKIIPFLLVLFWILIATSLQLTKTDTGDAFGSSRVIPFFTELYLTAIFGAFETSGNEDNFVYPDWVSLIFMSLSLTFIIFMYTMIAFVSKEYCNIWDQKGLILAHEKAGIILDIYNVMSERQRKDREDEYKIVSKLFEETVVDGSGATFHRTSTRNDIRETESHLRSENAEIMKEISQVRKENIEMNEKIAEVTKTLSELVLALKTI